MVCLKKKEEFKSGQIGENTGKRRLKLKNHPFYPKELEYLQA